ncbi:MAG: hypothetical protein WBF33_15265, partial [Candidatus Nitrosopolaris sp.]
NKQVLSKFISIMANVINNTDLDKVAQTIENGKKDKQSLRKPVKLQDEWNLDPSKDYQFRTELSSGYYFMFYSYFCKCCSKPRSKADQACREYGMHD